MYYVYTLVDPRNDEVFYVGITSSINTRFQAHMSLRENNTEKNARIRSLQEENMAPCMEVIETVQDEITALTREKYWIDYFNQQEIQLTNIRKLKKGIRGQYSSSPWKDCYTAPEASKVLGVSVHVFHKWVREGKFSPLSFFPLLQQPVYPLYPRSQIDNYARNLQAVQQPYNVEELYYTDSEASSVLDVSPYVFRRLVREKTINKITFPHRTEGYYSKSEVDNYARNLKALQEPYSTETLQFGLALNEDIPAIHALTTRVSGGEAHAVPEEVLRAWIRKNPQSIHILRKGTEIVGYISAFSLPAATLDLRLRGRLLNRTIPVDDIMPFAPNTTLSLYIAEMAVKHSDAFIKNDEPDPDKPDPVARLLGARLIRETSRFISYLRKQGTTVNELYAVGTSQFGIRMCRELGMTAIDLPEGVRSDRVPFKIDLQQNSQSVIVRRLRIV